MKVLKVILASIAVLLLVLALVAPLGPIPGLFIGGTSAKAPEKWGDTSNANEIMLRVPGTVFCATWSVILSVPFLRSDQAG